MVSKIIATGSAVPKPRLTNEMLSAWMDTNDEWIRTRTGIHARHVLYAPEAGIQEGSASGEKTPAASLLDLAACAAERALEMAEEKGLARSEIGLVLAATCTPDEQFPALSCRLQGRLGLSSAAAFDVSLACTGFLAALSTADAYIRAGLCKTVLVVGGDAMSRLINWHDRSTAILFGDAAGAVIVSGDVRFQHDGKSGILRSIMHADGTGGDLLACKALYRGDIERAFLEAEQRGKAEAKEKKLTAEQCGGEAAADCAGESSSADAVFQEAKEGDIHMDGRQVFSFATRKVPEAVREVLCGMEEAPRYYILHQANYRIIESVAKKLKEPMEKFPTNLSEYGNTTAATIPVLLDELNRKGSLAEGDLLCLSGFGAGLSYGAMLLRW